MGEQTRSTVEKLGAKADQEVLRAGPVLAPHFMSGVGAVRQVLARSAPHASVATAPGREVLAQLCANTQQLLGREVLARSNSSWN